RLERANAILVALCQRDVVPSVEQAQAARRIDGECVKTVPADNRLLLEVDRERQRRPSVQCGSDFGCFFVRDGRCQQSVLGGVTGKDVAERWPDDAADTKVMKRIDRRLARGAATKVVRADQDPGLAPFRPIDGKVYFLMTLCVET